MDSWYKGRLFYLNGLTGPSQRAEAIETIGHYLVYGDPSQALPALGYGYENEREWAIHQFLMDRTNGQSKTSIAVDQTPCARSRELRIGVPPAGRARKPRNTQLSSRHRGLKC